MKTVTEAFGVPTWSKLIHYAEEHFPGQQCIALVAPMAFEVLACDLQAIGGERDGHSLKRAGAPTAYRSRVVTGIELVLSQDVDHGRVPDARGVVLGGVIYP